MSEKKFTPSKKRLNQAKKKGDRIKVIEINTCLQFFCFICLIPYLLENIEVFLDTIYSGPKDFHTNIMLLSLSTVLELNGKTILLFLLITYLLTLFAELMQLGFRISLQRIKFNLSELGVKHWWKRNFINFESSANLIFLKVVLKMLICFLFISLIFFKVFYQNANFLFSLDFNLNWEEVFIIIQKQFLIDILIFVILLTLVLFYSAYFQRKKRLRMSLEEIKKEIKEDQGEPYIRALRKELYQQILYSALLSGIKKAKVLVVGSKRLN